MAKEIKKGTVEISEKVKRCDLCLKVINEDDVEHRDGKCNFWEKNKMFAAASNGKR